MLNKSAALMTLTLLMGCYPSRLPYSPATRVTTADVDPSRWVYTVSRSDARDENERKMIDDAVRLANSVLLSDCFREGLLSASLSSTNGRDNQQILAELTRLPPSALTIDLYDGTGRHGTIGWENDGEPDVVHMNRHYVKNAFVAADNLLHEAAHVRGFHHRSHREARSVPYTVNYIFEICAARFADGEVSPLQLKDADD